MIAQHYSKNRFKRFERRYAHLRQQRQEIIHVMRAMPHDGRPQMPGVPMGIAVSAGEVRGSRRWQQVKPTRDASFECRVIQADPDVIREHGSQTAARIASIESLLLSQGHFDGWYPMVSAAPQEGSQRRRKASKRSVRDDRAASLAARRRAVHTFTADELSA